MNSRLVPRLQLVRLNDEREQYDPARETVMCSVTHFQGDLASRMCHLESPPFGDQSFGGRINS